MSKTTPAFILTGALALALPALSEEPTKEQLDFFESKIRPLLAEKCYKCHSQEAGKMKGSLTLDTVDATRNGGETGPGVVPGDLEKSLVYKAITYTDKDLEMPPSSSGGKLSDQEIADVAAWIKMGAPDPRKEPAKASKLSGLTEKARSHWSYQPLKKRVKIPANKNQQWCRTPIDAFILQKLEAKGILPSPDANREILLRRAYYDMIGLPPSPAEIAAFLADPAPNAWEKVIDRLLASPHYGERWGRYWLDTARYADTRGGDFNNNNMRADYRYANAWTYRDYVVRSFNEDKPYNQFIIEQIAADELYPIKPLAAILPASPAPAPAAPKTAAAKPGTAAQPTAPADSAMMDGMMGASASGMKLGLGEVAGNPNLAALGFLTVGMRFNNANDLINDRIDVVTKGFLGVTVSCARCHDHMFDPIPQSDYYALHGVFASSDEPEDKPLIAAPDPALRADYEKKVAEVEKENRDIYYNQVEHWLNLLHAKPAEYMQAGMFSRRGGEKALQARQELISKSQLDTPFTNYLQRFTNSSHPVFGPAKKFEELDGDFSQRAAKVLKEIQTGRYNQLVVDALVKANPASMSQVYSAYEDLSKKMAPKLRGLAPALKAATTETVAGYSPAELEFLAGPFSIVAGPKATPDWIRDAIGGWNNQMTGRARFVFAKLNDLELTHPGAPARAMVMVDKTRPQDSKLLLRGQTNTPADTVPRGFLSILSPEGKSQPFKKGSGRLELAQAIASKDNPLTPRVLINRVWMRHFGEGFVRTPDDIGVMSEQPSHPELLEYLASWFVDESASGGRWSLKKLHKFIMLSRVYQASSYIPKGGAKYVEIDPDNRLLWRANVRRLDFEAFRDSLLAMSGRLDAKMGGQPVNITDEPYFDANGRARRSIYGYIDRGALPELMAHFDFSDPDMPNSKRTTTIVPQQALFLMNSPMSIDVARQIIARSEFQRADSDLRRVFTLYRIVFQRQPMPDEIRIGLDFVQKEKNKQKEVDALAPELAKKNAEIEKRIADMRKRDNDARRAVQNEGKPIERKPLQPWEAYAHALLFANEAAYVN